MVTKQESQDPLIEEAKLKAEVVNHQVNVVIPQIHLGVGLEEQRSEVEASLGASFPNSMP